MSKKNRSELRGYVLITTDNYSVESAVGKYGLRPLLVGGSHNTSLGKMYNLCDAVIIPGGSDIDPELYGAEAHRATDALAPKRDTIEHYIAQRALLDGKPILGICRGHQMLNVAAAGTLIQDIPTQIQTNIKHTSSQHDVYVTEKKSLFATICLADKYRGNSLHHQAVDQVGYRFQVVARAQDGIPEAIMSREHPFALGVQFHPEMLVSQKHEQSLAIFEALAFFTNDKYAQRSEHSRRRSHAEYRRQLEYSEWVSEYYKSKSNATKAHGGGTEQGMAPLSESAKFNCETAAMIASMYGE